MGCTVTIGVCVKNGANTILDTLRSISLQTFPHEQMELIIVDDGSNDGTYSIVSQYVQNLNITANILSCNWQGLGQSRNLIAKKSSGKYVIWVDSDMALSKNFVEQQFNFMENNPKVGIAKGVYGIIPNLNLVAFLENLSFVAENYQYECGTGGSIYRVEALRQAGYFNGRLKFAGEDHDVVFRINSLGWLLMRSSAVFYEQPRTSWKNLWSKYSKWGLGLHNACRQTPRLLVLYQMLPFAGFIGGFKRSLIAYRLTCKKRVFLLPIQFVFKLTAWCFGYLKGYFN